MARALTIPAKGGTPAMSTGMSGVERIDVDGLRRALARAVEGEVRFDAGSRALYATDGSNFRQPPIGVVIPKTIDDVIQTHAVCREFRAPILARGAGTSLSGETVNYAVVIDFSKYLNRIDDPNVATRTVHVQPGAINEKVNEHTGKWGLVFGPDPSTHAYCTIGGNVGNNSCGMHSLQARMAGNGSRTSDNVASLDVLTFDGIRMRVGPTSPDECTRIVAEGGRRGQIYRDLADLAERYAPLIRQRFVNIPRRVSGYNLDELLPEKGFNVARALVGTEGTCVTVLDAELMLIDLPKKRALMVVGYEDIYSCGDHLMEILDARPIACEALDHTLYSYMRGLRKHLQEIEMLPPGRAWLLVEFGGETQEEADEKARALQRRLERDRRRPEGVEIIDKLDQEKKLWETREGGLSAEAFPPNERDHFNGWEDSAVAPERIGPYLRDLKKLYDKYGYAGALYGHFGDGCVHSMISFDLRTAEGLRTYRSFMEEAADLVVSYGGTLSGEHGDGQQRAELLPKMYGQELVDAFREFKRIWDPEWKMNPGKVVDAYRFDENLKLGVNYEPWRPKTVFHFGQDGDDFAHATVRCVGVGKCRTPGGVDVMCPSYIVTKEEKHTTRGRARLLFEMLQGDIIKDRWRSREVKEALDLCLSCKGCTNDCPVNVDMPTYKAEFLHHHWKQRVRPRHAYALGLIDKAARAASLFPGAINLLGRTRPFAPMLKLAAGVTQERPIPSFAPVSLQKWFSERGERNIDGPKVILWPDTFNNYMDTGVGVAAVEALEAAGWHVTMPRAHVCCGRPLYDYGMLDVARRYLQRCIDELRTDIRAGVPVVGMEPSCVATFKHELRQLFPHDDDAQRLEGSTYHFAEFLEKFEVDVPVLRGDAILWVHCHEKATGDKDAEKKVLERMGLDVKLVKGGCCGLAGSWGFEPDHYDLSMKIGDVALLPAVRDADATTFVVADGFSCKTQIEDARIGRRALHVAQVMQLARGHGAQGPRNKPPEDAAPKPPPPSTTRKLRRAACAAAAVALGSLVLVRAARRS
ncbi:MAG: FAD-binding and (Fe-S)-binding domain-containing protein [Actinomycetota bacterium]